MSTVGSGSEVRTLSEEQTTLVRRHLREVLESRTFSGSKRAQEFLNLLVKHALAGEFDCLRERMIGVEMFGRPVDYDTANDSVVRVKATEVRKKLAQYYLEVKGKPGVQIALPSGQYVPTFFFQPSESLLQPPKVETSAHQTNGVAPHQKESSHDVSEGSANEQDHLILRIVDARSRLVLGISIGLLVLITAGYFVYQRLYVDSHLSPPIRSIAVLPFENLSGDSKQDYFADAMTEELTDNLGALPALRVISRTSAMTYKNTRKRVPEIGHELSVDGIVEGSVLCEGDHVRITARLIDARTDRPTWKRTYVSDLTNVSALQGELAQAIAEDLSISVTTPSRSGSTRFRPVNTKAEDLYMRGMMYVDAGDRNNAIGLFLESISADPDFAPAHAALADCYGRMGDSGNFAYSDPFNKQKTEALRAIELDDLLPEGHAQFADAAMELDWDWGIAAKEFERALELNPSSAPIHENYAIYLDRIGKFKEAIAESERGIELDPAGARSFWLAGFSYYYSRQYDKALQLGQEAEALRIESGRGPFFNGLIYAEKKMYREATAEFMKMGDDSNSPHILGHLGNTYARAGQLIAARKVISRLETNIQKDGVGEYEVALVYAGLGQKDQAFDWLERSYKSHSYGLMHLKIDPCLDPLRSDPRFNEFVRRVGLQP